MEGHQNIKGNKQSELKHLITLSPHQTGVCTNVVRVKKNVQIIHSAQKKPRLTGLPPSQGPVAWQRHRPPLLPLIAGTSPSSRQCCGNFTTASPRTPPRQYCPGLTYLWCATFQAQTISFSASCSGQKIGHHYGIGAWIFHPRFCQRNPWKKTLLNVPWQDFRIWT